MEKKKKKYILELTGNTNEKINLDYGDSAIVCYTNLLDLDPIEDFEIILDYEEDEDDIKKIDAAIEDEDIDCAVHILNRYVYGDDIEDAITYNINNDFRFNGIDFYNLENDIDLYDFEIEIVDSYKFFVEEEEE